MDSAQLEFRLNTQKEIMNFITNLGVAGLEERNCLPLKKARWKPPPPPEDIPVYAYNFWTSEKGGSLSYLAFFKNPKTLRWTLKSFKADRQQQRNLPLRNNYFLKLRQKLSSLEDPVQAPKEEI